MLYSKRKWKNFVFEEVDRDAIDLSSFEIKDTLSPDVWEDDDFLCETRGRIRPRILEEVRGQNLFYYIELPGILSRDDIEVELQSNIITVRAKLRKGVVYQGVTKELNVSEYLADIILPYAPSPDDIHISFDRRRGLLIISVSRRGEKKRLRIEEI